MQEFNEGDLVKAVKGERRAVSRLVQSKWRCNTGGFGLHLDGFEHIPYANSDEAGRAGWTFTVIEKAAPKLPTEPGIYESKLFPIARGNAPYLLTTSGWSMEAEDLDLDHMRRLVPLIRLERESITAKKVLDAIRQRIGSIDSAHDFQAVAAEFGVTE